MLRLQTTLVLSVLALAIGLGGTQWLSEQSELVSAPSLAAVNARIVPQPHRRRPPPQRIPVSVAPPPAHRSRLVAAEIPRSAAADTPPLLVPIDMPSEHGTPYEKLRGHLDGRVVVHLTVDGQGGVTAAELVQSSSDAVLDAHALRSVRGWRFAVPPGHLAGLSANFPMQFSSHDEVAASAP